MSDERVNVSRRRFLAASTAVVGAAGAVGVAIPFVGSWEPSAKAKAAGAPVKVDLSKLEPGAMMIAEWRGKPVYIVRRTQEILDNLPKLNGSLKDPGSADLAQQPEYAHNLWRSIKKEYLVLVGLCTHLGCAPKVKFTVGVDPATDEPNASWLGGFFCPCHGSRFDLAGRVFKGVPAPINLLVPPYKYLSDTVIIVGVGEDEGGAA